MLGSRIGNGDHKDEQMVLNDNIGNVSCLSAFRGRPTLGTVQSLPGLGEYALTQFGLPRTRLSS